MRLVDYREIYKVPADRTDHRRGGIPRTCNCFVGKIRNPDRTISASFVPLDCPADCCAQYWRNDAENAMSRWRRSFCRSFFCLVTQAN